MKHIKFNKKMNKEYLSISSRPFSVHTYHQKRDILFKCPLDKKINYSFYNKYIYTNNYNNITKLYLKKNQKLNEYKTNEIINEEEEINNKPNYDNLNVKIFNLYNIKNKNEPFDIRINNNSPKNYINNSVNQLLLKKLSPKNRNKNNVTYLNNKTNNNENINLKDNKSLNNKYILSLISPKNKNYKKNDFHKNNINTNVIDIKKCNNNKIIKNNIKGINNIRLNHQNKQRRIINLYNHENYSYNNIYKISPKNIHNNTQSILEKKNLNFINNSNLDIFNKRSTNIGLKTNKNIEIKNIMNKNRMNLYNRVLNSNLTFEIPERMSYNKKYSPKIDNIINNQTNSLLDLNKNEINHNNTYLFSDNKRDIEKIKNKNRIVNSIFDLKKNKFESKTLNEIIQEFNQKEEKEKDFEKIETVNNNKIKHKIPYQKIKYKKLINNTDIIKVPKNFKKSQKNDFDIYLKYNQKNDVEKILLNDKNGKIRSFIPVKNNDQYNTINKEINKNTYSILDI